MNREPDIGEQALDKAAEIAISSQLDHVEQVSVDVATNPGKLVQGKVDSVNVAGKGMVFKQELRIENLEVEAGAVNINPFKALIGQMELTQPADAQAQIVLTEADLNQALSSEYLRRKITGLEVSVQGKSHHVDLQQVSLELVGSGKMALDVTLALPESAEQKQLQAVVIPTLKDDGNRIDFEILSAECQGMSLEFVTALFRELMSLLDFRNFELDGFSLQLKRLEVVRGKLLIDATTVIEKIPEVD